jgi:hypothetical protein
MRQSIVSLFIMGGVLSLSSLPAPAQINPSNPPENSASPTGSTDIYFINRAKNLARQAAITANGGLERYRPDPVMFGPAVQTQYTRNDDGSITFSFGGGAPGLTTPSLETVATVSTGGAVKLDYNGPLRSNIGAGSLPITNQALRTQSPPASPSFTPALPKLPASNSTAITPTMVPSGGNGTAPSDRPLIGWVDEDAFFSKARNLARQSAIKANGGLSRYRPEPSMFGPSAQTPAVKNANGSITFSFKGGAPSTPTLTTESVVTVNPTGNVNLEYNGPIR